MKDFMNSAGVWIRHNMGLVTALVICAAALTWGLGCESTVTSISDPTEKVTRPQLVLELKKEATKIDRTLAESITDLNLRAAQIGRDIEAAKLMAADDTESLKSLAEIKIADLDKQDAIKQKALEIGAGAAQGDTLDPVGIAFSIAGLLGIGAIVDNRKKDGIIAGQKMATPPAES